jgi:multiple sugar transport system ATP-binding protein
MASVSFKKVGKVYPDGTRALGGFDLDVDHGEFIVFVGPSGCGKTTALRMLAGLEEITEGEILIDGGVVNDREPRERDVAMVFQNYALYPHMSVFDNIAFGLQSRRVPKDVIRQKVGEISGVLGLTDQLRKKPRALSGGQRQRVAMGRAIVREPAVFLMDEPLSNLDAKLRVQMRAEISRIQRSLGATTIYVTHDQIEALTMADRVVVLRKGELQQDGPPQELYDAPANLFVASFIGSPAMNLVQARIALEDGRVECVVGDQRLDVPPRVVAAHPDLAARAGQTIALGIRPEHLNDAAFVQDDRPRLHGVVQLTEALGSERLVYVAIKGDPVVTGEVLEIAGDVDAAAVEELESEARAGRTTFVGRVDARSRATTGESIELAVDADRLYFFDLESSRAI